MSLKIPIRYYNRSPEGPISQYNKFIHENRTLYNKISFVHNNFFKS